MPDDPDDRTDGSAQRGGGSTSSEDRFAHERGEAHELDLVRRELRRHDRQLRDSDRS